MSAVRDGVRQVMAWLHGWTGLLLGWVLFVMCLAGTLSVFKPEIGQWMRPEATAKADPVEALATAGRWLAANTKDTTGWYLTAPDDRTNTIEAAYDSGGTFLYRALDPVSGASVARETMGGEFFYRLHFELELPYPWGRMLASLAAAVMLTALITGIIAHRRIFRDYFTFRTGKGQRSWLDGHNALGVLALPFHLMITFTGLITLASVSLPWGVDAAYGENVAAMYAEIAPGVAQRAPTGTKAPLAPLAPMLHEAQRRFGGAPIGRVYVLNPGDSGAVVSVFRADASVVGYMPAEVSFDGATGRMLAEWTENRPAIQTYNTVYGLHMGRFAPALTRWLYFLGGAMLTLTIASGLVLWIVKRRERAPLSLANRILERLNVGVIAGVPLGCVAFLLANRVLPLGIAGRAEAEVSIALWTAAAALVAGAVLPPRLAWPLLFGLTGAGCLVAALSVPLGGTVLILGNLMLLVTAAAFAALVGRQLLPRRATPVRRARAAA
ncbi:PepSY-associated TM helix domain-containing protein [Sphingomonas sp. HF-S4]|uniref:PepSY-associated TM helix domain-containing protein n=1 Tax=Sphingomonas agrestis TaxID=3080540 RepID=A0ABU3Y889_9SPHN|nr:PepSY-associated TM helix domain-containing protein [Sphingomonas sp. HF-S4]MDV3457532.1 PepSY-associated TM helix domain-containing protein [Sphingomonas sp. HF-S4]